MKSKMMIRQRIVDVCLAVLLASVFTPVVHAADIQYPQRLVEHAVWDKSPIKVTLPVGRERRIDFPVPGNKFEVPEMLLHKSKPIQMREDGSIYWTALEPFESTRVQFLTPTGYSYFLDVEAIDDSKAKHKILDRPLVIIDTRVKQNDDKSRDDDGLASAKRLDYDYVDLIRLASQSIYGPERLIKKLPGVSRIGVDPCAVRLYRGSQLVTEPIAQWKANTVPSQYVTAIRVTSNALEDVVFDPRRIRGEFVAAAAQHPLVKAVMDKGDTTTWYLVSKKPFQESAPATCMTTKEVASHE